jgi:hypothetical protein
MAPNEWERLALRHNASYPAQQLDPFTAAEFYEKLSGFPAGEVWDAIDRHRSNITVGRDGLPIGRWAPTLADILACIDANWRERAAERRQLLAMAARVERNSRGGTPAPPETKEAIRLLEATKRLPGTPGHMDLAVALIRMAGLSEQLNQRLEREQTGTLA